MKVYTLKKDVDKAELKKRGFKITETPVGIVAYRLRENSEESKGVIIFLENKGNIVDWRFVSMRGQPIEEEISDILDLLDVKDK